MSDESRSPTWDRIGATYDAVANKYEARFLDELTGKPRDRELLQAFADSVTDPVVEIGSGPGQIGAFVKASGRTVLGLDLSSLMARLAATRLDAGLAGDMRSLPFADRAFGGLLAFYSLIHVRRAELGAVMKEFHRVLRPGGRLMVSAHEGSGELEVTEFIGEPVPIVATLFELAQLEEASRAAGLEVTLAERRPPYANEGQTTRLYLAALRPRH